MTDPFDSAPWVGRVRLPPWLKVQLPPADALQDMSRLLRSKKLYTVCEEAQCMNRMECWAHKTATVLALGDACTRACAFCNIGFTKTPQPVDAEEARRIADFVQELQLRHVVITMVTRDDLPDGGAKHIADIVSCVRQQNPDTAIEVLTSDFQGRSQDVEVVIEANPNVFAHNVETVRALSPSLRHKATYDRSLEVLQYVKRQQPTMLVKSGIMVGVGETAQQVAETLADLNEIGCDIVTIGQYLQPSRGRLPVKRFVPPEEFQEYAALGHSLGIHKMVCGPHVRSSYQGSSNYR